ncbi:lipid A deacylase LpxR family protein [Magnetospirillum sulfuroxidans]|uniref:Lipid A deacylase LpxR family protein n=1 Tax=Magnetospirillum sulfuroxidans TaxID=611300 RepID=A0ABS5I8X9_9PROT|nr:lipid A deacylase LpxR family protein [Magnetospirillum sulfuroxidans]MBR9970867.1 lipid A deacylase LpxR family protein [Magnetospirillum sulfuroxidans]
MVNLAQAGDAYRFTLLEENDSLYADSDQHYTQGLRLSVLSPALARQDGWNDAFDLMAGLGPVFITGEAASARRISLFLGQSIFTPQDTARVDPDPDDRPYGGWLYAGVGLLQETDRHMLEQLELAVGVVGPAALGRQAQNDYHQFINIAEANGWGGGIQTEPGLMLSYERLWRVPLAGDGDNGVDIVPQLGATLGNVFTYAGGGALLRAGRNLRGDYGPARIRPGLTGTDYFDDDHLDGALGFYFFAGIQGRAVGRNIFLDGNSFRQSPRVDKNIFVGDVQAGVSLFWSNDFHMTVSAVRRSREFEGQNSPDVIGTATLGFSW